MNDQDTKFNYKIIVAAFIAIVIGIVIAFYFSYAHSNNKIEFLEEEKELLVKEITLMKTEVDHLSALNEVNDIELKDSRYRVQELLDSVGQLNFTLVKLRQVRKELRKLESRHDSLRLKNNFLKNNNNLITEKYKETSKRIEDLIGENSSLAEKEALLRKQRKELSEELKIKSYLKLQDAEADGFRLRNDKATQTNKGSTIEKLRGCVTVGGNPNVNGEEKVLYFQFLDPDKQIIEDNANIVSVNGNVYSKRVELIFMGVETQICDFITIPKGSLKEGAYTLNVFENEKLLATSQFQLK